MVLLRKRGMKINEIARRVGLGRRTVQSWLAHDRYPETRYHTRRRCGRFDAYEAYIRQRWDGGERNIQHLWREVQAQGYPHSARALRNHMEPLQATGTGCQPTTLSYASRLKQVGVVSSEGLRTQRGPAWIELPQASKVVLD